MNPDEEILNAVRPSLAITQGPLFMISSPYARRGELWQLYQRHYGPIGDERILIAQGASRVFNPTLPEHVVTRALARDRATASAEYLAEFRSDIEGFVSLEAVQACIDVGCRERAPAPGVHPHVGFVDPSGGSADSMTLAIAHRESDLVVLDCVREIVPPFSPDDATSEFAAVLKSYRVAVVHGDRFGGEWPRERFKWHGIRYEVALLPKSGLYQELLPRLNAGTIRLLDNDRLVGQLVGLERRHGRTGRDTIDHAPNSHDDLANVLAGVASVAGAPSRKPQIGLIDHRTGRITLLNEEQRTRLWTRRWITEQQLLDQAR